MSDESSLTSPEGILMLLTAGLLDCFGFAIALVGTWFGIDDYGILDIFGILIIGGWLLLRGMGVSSVVSKARAKGLLARFIGASVVELVPVVGGISPSWTWLVWKELGGMGGGSKQKESEDDESKSQEKPTPSLPQRDASAIEKNNSTAV